MNKQTSTPEYYRNLITIHGIDPGALWERTGDLLTLVDQDQFVRAQYAPDKFTRVDPDEPFSGSATR